MRTFHNTILVADTTPTGDWEADLAANEVEVDENVSGTVGDSLLTKWRGCGEPQEIKTVFLSPMTERGWMSTHFSSVLTAMKGCPPGS